MAHVRDPAVLEPMVLLIFDRKNLKHANVLRRHPNAPYPQIYCSHSSASFMTKISQGASHPS